ncbi:hypothetical protein Pcinc_013414 [Petrolisthes cinctipes]|uniref:WD repeat-containing protein 79 n=1 Tax=Petrolisthes cinctipes TaxID=88211 RepID=A0AAE1FXH0_PETCI|nr:hypothetical protein Pcinc_013414 [Petrolisthes cinctipes]
MDDRADIGDGTSEVLITTHHDEDMVEPLQHLSKVSPMEYQQNTCTNLDLGFNRKFDKGCVFPNGDKLVTAHNEKSKEGTCTSIIVQSEEPLINDTSLQIENNSSRERNESDCLRNYTNIIEKVNGHNETDCVTNKVKNIEEKTEEILLTVCGLTDDSGNVSKEGNERETLCQSSLKFDAPLLALDFKKEFNTSKKDNYTKGCKWSPDGSCLLVASNDNKVRILNLPTPLLQDNFPSERWFCEEAEQYGYAAVTVKERELVYDYTWYPAMRSDDPRTCCFAVTCRDLPVHLWDAWNGQLICSYYCYDHLDQMVAAYSIGFNLDGSRLVCGFSKCLRVFHINRPGRICDKIDAKGQPGILSCVAFNPQLPSIMVAGSYLGSLGLYNTQRNNLFMRIDGCSGGVTHVQFSADGTKLFSGMRKSSEILCWDIRNPGTLLCAYKREVSTSQRIYFDLDMQQNRHLVSGNTNGEVSHWDLSSHAESQVIGEDMTLRHPTSTFSAHKDCTNGISIHPYYPILATSSGQRHYPEPLSDSGSNSEGDCGPEEVSKPLFSHSRTLQENTVKLWSLRK